MCAHGWVGKFCEADAIPACRNASGSALACTTRQEPLPCACVRQCVAAGAFAAHMREPWGAPVCSWRGSYVSWKLDQAGKVQRASDTAKHPLRGASKPAHHWWDGQYESWTCFNGCAGRGACIRGSCVCTATHYGPGCAHRLGDEAREATVPASRLRLFVYDLPALITGRRSYGSDWDKAYIFSTAQARAWHGACMACAWHVHGMAWHVHGILTTHHAPRTTHHPPLATHHSPLTMAAGLRAGAAARRGEPHARPRARRPLRGARGSH